MFYGISKIVFEGHSLQNDKRDLYSLTEKVKKKFNASVKIPSEFKKTGSPILMIAVLENEEANINRTLDKIIDLCEDSGMGRVISEKAMIDFIDFED